MNYFAIISTAALFGLVSSARKFGKKCTNDSTCNELGYSLDYGLKPLTCIDGFCRCNDTQLNYDSDLEPYCGEMFFDLKYNRCNSTSCKENAECSMVESTWRCICKDGFIYVEKKCIKVSYVNALERCYVTKSGEARSCNVKEHSICAKGKCICFETFYPYTTSGKCEPMARYVKANYLPGYFGRPRKYCREDCIPGFRCLSGKCRCPSTCVHDKGKKKCNCRSSSKWFSFKISSILSSILGLGISGFCACGDKRTIKKKVKKNTSPLVNLERIEMSPERTDLFALCPAPRSGTASPAPPIGLSFPANAEGQAPVSNDTLPYKPVADPPNGSPLPPPQASLYGINDPYSTTPSAPPNYSVTPSATDIAPPTYSPYPVNAEGSPYPVNAEGSPYPVNAEGSPYPVNAEGSPYPVNAEGSPYPVNAEGSPYPVNAEGSPYPVNAEGSPYPVNAEGSPYPVNAEGSPYPVNAEGSPYPVNAEGSPYPVNAEGSPYPVNAEGSPYPVNAEGSPYPVNAGGSPYPVNAEGSPYPVNAEGSPYPVNAEGSPYPVNAEGSPYPVNAGGSPYPVNAGGSPYPVNAGGSPYPVNAGGSPYPVNAGGLPYPTDSVVPDPPLASQGGLPYSINPSGPSTDIPRKE